MAKVSAEARARYTERIRKYTSRLEQLSARERNLSAIVSKADSGFEVQKLALAELLLNKVSCYLVMDALSERLLGVKNDGFLNEARKVWSQSVIQIEEVVSDFIDPSISDLKDRLDAISGLDEKERFRLIHKLGFALESVREAFGEGSKWKWAFVDMEARFATVAKNILDLRTLVEKLDPRVEGYRERVQYLELVKRLLMQAAERYRERYELATHRLEDFRKAILYLESYKRLMMLLGEREEVEMVSKKIEVWRNKMEDDEKKMQQRGAAGGGQPQGA
ncbi:hypothetical protein [Spirochaeta thermophila]|uniref:Uncharacterized protein n=1 Tax=Winmispira thermophila (strain ATCC 49972 / DSM 6192 / RI 19.B1) TaxID=665571 RepID=E0RS45_WINT6|nr:hypothetical protein [Spirochaeta thermophila]ADN01832.1 hypothetical protein STHERM_c08850 [Spirochaeta thermophila DSM 6192]